MWPDWVIHWTLGNFSKPVATIILPTFLGIFCKVVKIFNFASEIIFGQLLQTFGDFLLVTLVLMKNFSRATPNAEHNSSIFETGKYFSTKTCRVNDNDPPMHWGCHNPKKVALKNLFNWTWTLKHFQSILTDLGEI